MVIPIKTFKNLQLLYYNPKNFCYYKPNFALISSIFIIGFFACSIKSEGNSIAGNSYFKQLYTFSKVFNFMYGQSLQAHELFGGAGIKVLFGLLFCI